jgi:hypothetical protein
MFEAAELRSKNAAILADVSRALDGRFSMDRTTSTMKAMVSSCLEKAEEDHIVATSKHLHRDYDPNHPERITCMVFARDKNHKVNFLVLVNNRKYDIVNMTKIWLRRSDRVGEEECSTCLKLVASVWRCCYCRNATCRPCYSRLEHASVAQCPVCRQWCLEGSRFGFPRSRLFILEPLFASVVRKGKAVDALVELLNGLDGEVSVVPRWGNTFLLDSEERFFRHSGSAWPTETTGHARRRLARLLEHLPVLSFHVFRKTFDIDPETNRPVLERSVLCSAPGCSLLQVPNDSWHDVFQSEIPFVHRKVEYLEPAAFLPREDLQRLFLEELPTRFPGASVTVLFRFRPTRYMAKTALSRAFDVSYDTDPDDGRPTTMSRSALLWLLCHIPSIPTAQNASVRVIDLLTKTELFRTEFKCQLRV